MDHDSNYKQGSSSPAKPLSAGLYIVATPIGNLRDITLRALDTLAACDVVLCEDTRVSGRLLSAYSIRKPLLSYNDHSDTKRRDEIIAKLQNGQVIALISDAGSPLISDPGYKLVRSCMEAGIAVTSIPGASAVIAGLQLSGLPSDSFSFIGFLPAKQKARREALERSMHTQSTLIAYETGPRLQDSLADIHAVLGNRRLCVARELTKLYEEKRLCDVAAHMEYYREYGAPKGEIVLVIEGAGAQDMSEGEVEALLKEALKTKKTKDAANAVADISGRPRKELYALALKLAAAAGE
ncbi:MAG: 16S rRNA (cytidine(1402)-2'-O)-methyltransferase [Alphaproteobacteria bacterium]